MKRTFFFAGAAMTLAALATYLAAASEHADGQAVPIFGIKIFPGYRDWKLISVAHEAGNLNDIRAVLGNDIAIKSYRDGRQSFPDGAVIARLSWNYVPSEENNKVFGREQSFVAGSRPDWYLQFMVKDSKKYAATGGWGYAQFDKDGKPADEAKLGTCFPCHVPVKDRDYVFTRYAP
jgi:Cytochrome P460